MRDAGVNRDCTVVVYDDQHGFTACRLWWTLRYFGHDGVAVLDSGLAGWPGPLATGPHSVPRGDFVATEPRMSMKVEYEGVRDLPGGCVLLDARGPERYRGEVEPTDPRAGHIPGAFSAPWGGNLDGAGRFKCPDELVRRFRDLRVDDGCDVVAYCGSGVSACVNLLAGLLDTLSTVVLPIVTGVVSSLTSALGITIGNADYLGIRPPDPTCGGIPRLSS